MFPRTGIFLANFARRRLIFEPILANIPFATPFPINPLPASSPKPKRLEMLLSIPPPNFRKPIITIRPALVNNVSPPITPNLLTIFNNPLNGPSSFSPSYNANKPVANKANPPNIILNIVEPFLGSSSFSFSVLSFLFVTLSPIILCNNF